MKFDDLDMQILRIFLQDEDNLTTSDVAKFIFKPKNRDALIKKTNLIDYRMKKLAKDNIITFEIENGIRYYCLIEEKFTFGESYLTVNGKQIETGLAITYKLPDNNYIIKFLEEEDVQ